MKRYFFHVFDGREFRDETGTMLPSHIEVRMHMLALAQTWMGLQREKKVLWRMEACDEDGHIVGSIRFGLETDDDLKPLTSPASGSRP